jgi:hypothetical protein
MSRIMLIILAAGILVVCSCTGCQGKLTRQRYETIYLSMPHSKVREVLGDPNHESPTEWSYVHHEPYHRATIRFDGGKVIDKSWSLEELPQRK